MPKRWTPFEKATPIPPQWVKDKAPELIPEMQKLEVWKNSRYTVDVRRFFGQLDGKQTCLIHLSIKSNDRTAVHDWRDFQRIKNEICGPEEEAFELFPAESRLVDTSNQYHLWCFKGIPMPVGFNCRLVSDKGDPCGAVQRPWEEGARPPDAQRYITTQEMVMAMKQELREQGEKFKP